MHDNNSISSAHQFVNNFFCEVETIFNVADCIPIVSLYTVGIGFTVAIVQTVAGGAIALTAALFEMAAANKENEIFWSQLVDMGLEHMGQGATRALSLCSFRALFAATVILSPLNCLASGQNFRPYMPYQGTEEAYGKSKRRAQTKNPEDEAIEMALAASLKTFQEEKVRNSQAEAEARFAPPPYPYQPVIAPGSYDANLYNMPYIQPNGQAYNPYMPPPGHVPGFLSYHWVQ